MVRNNEVHNGLSTAPRHHGIRHDVVLKGAHEAGILVHLIVVMFTLPIDLASLNRVFGEHAKAGGLSFADEALNVFRMW